MNRLHSAGIRLVLGLGVALTGATELKAADAITTAVFSQAEKGYKRKKAKDGSWEREYYAMSNGGVLPGTTKDVTVDKVHFSALAGLMAEHLAKQGYWPATGDREPDLLIVIHYGTTLPFNDGTYRGNIENTATAMNSLSEMMRNNPGIQAPAASPDGSPPQSEISLSGSVQDMERQAASDAVAGAMIVQDLFNKAREEANIRNAKLLGYLQEINEANGIQRFAGGGDKYNDLVGDIEESRYYVIISAYDFKSTVREKKPRLQWVTRVSIRTPGNNFADRMTTMVANASRYFGRESGRLVRQYEREGTVDIGEATVVGTMSDTAVQEQVKESGREPAK